MACSLNSKSFPAFPLSPLFPLHLKYLIHGVDYYSLIELQLLPCKRYFRWSGKSGRNGKAEKDFHFKLYAIAYHILYCILGTYSNIICNILLVVYLMACGCKSFPAFPLSPLFPLHLKYFSTGLIIIHITKMAEKAGPIRNSCSLSMRSYFCVTTVDKTTWHKRIMLCFNANSCLKH